MICWIGNQEVVSMLLEAGADIDKKNSVNRTAAEMAGFVCKYNKILSASRAERFFRQVLLAYLS